eukprot:CAMPEP_0118924236 /NCGR_PEP_ID=MMETSP1169-20130426/2464_1 /TAXON_ID=36882 /ORGANISM="Pyramimonas obovata, Strain CCMP722" /LENGTH=159 /DNA_ID=CAMNT_0006865329 /DNA_START=201 /DNA_END=680 /DNA_ORIENTATION=+
MGKVKTGCLGLNFKSRASNKVEEMASQSFKDVIRGDNGTSEEFRVPGNGIRNRSLSYPSWRDRGAGRLRESLEGWSEFQPQSLVGQARDPFMRCSEESEAECTSNIGGSVHSAISGSSDVRSLRSLGVEDKVIDCQRSSLFDAKPKSGRLVNRRHTILV